MGKAKRFLAGILAAVVAFSSDGIVMAADTRIPEIRQESVKVTDMKSGIKKNGDKEAVSLEKAVQILDEGLEGRNLEPKTAMKSLKQKSIMSLKASSNDLTSTDKNFTYELNNNNEATITGYNGSADTIFLSDTIDGYKLIGIGDGAFDGHFGLKTIFLPASLTYLGRFAFRGTGIESITIPKNVKGSGGSYTYRNGALSGATSLKKVIFEDGITKIPDFICASDNYRSCVTEIVIPESVNEIGGCAFYNCISLPEVDIPKSVSRIEYGAFEGCTELTKVTMHYNDALINTATQEMQSFRATIGGSAFSGCSKLTDVELSENVTSIESAAFSGCKELKILTLPKSLIYLGEYVINNTGISSITIPKNVEKSGIDITLTRFGGALCGATSLKKIVFEDGMTKIPDYICASGNYSSYVTEIVIPGSVNEIGNHAFHHCISLPEVDIPKSVSVIGAGAFSDCTALVGVTMHYNDALINTETEGTQPFRTTIGKNAFSGCSKLTDVGLSENVMSIEGGAFSGCTKLESLTLPESLTYLGENVIRGTWISSITIPKNVKSNGYGVLCGATSLKKVVFEDGMTKIPDYICSSGSYSSYITAVLIPRSVTEIGNYAFYKCDNLIIYGYEDSYAKTYADENNIPFKNASEFDFGNNANEPELTVYSGHYSINQKSTLAICFVELDEPDQDYLEKFMSSLTVKNTTEHYGIDYSTDYRILDNGLSANLIITIDPSNSFDGLYTFEISSPGGQVKEITINCAVGNHFWSDEDNQITTEDVIMSKAEKEYLAAFDEFIDKTQGTVKENAKKVTQSVDNLADFLRNEYGAVITDVPKEMEEKGWDYYLYEALGSVVADIANARMSDISYSTDATTLGANIVKSVFKDYRPIKDSIEYKDKNGQVIVVEMKIQAMYGVFTGGMVCRNAQNPSESYTLGVLMTGEHTEKVLKQYANDLAKFGASAANSVYYAMAEDLLGKSLKDFTTDFLKNFTTKYGKKLAEMGLDGLIDFCSAGYDVYKDVNTFSKTLSNKDATKIQGQLKDSKKALDSFWDNATDKNLKRASGKVVKATEKILLLWEEYITTGTVTSHDGIKGFVQSIFSCPVSISVYDSNGTEIGYVGDDNIWYDNSISIKEQGDAKIIHTPFDEQVSFKIDGTGYGTLSCTFEEYDKSGKTLGRLNYYNISLSPDTEITAALPSENLIADHSDMAIYVDGNAVLADKCIPAEEYKDASISVSLQTNNTAGGIVYGAGNYILGNTVNLIALSNEGYIFTGWYNENDVLVSAKRNIEFAARNNINYTAHFDSVSDDSSDDNTKDALVQSILIQQSVAIQDGSKIQFDAKVLPENAANKILSWTSDNPSVALVDNNGLVTAVSAGQATITASSTDGSNVSASCVITVTKPDNAAPPDDNNNSENNPGGNDSNNGNSGENNSTGNNPSGGGSSNGSSSGGSTTGGNTSGGGSSNGSSSGGGTTGGIPSGGGSSGGGSTGGIPSGGGSTGGNSSGNGTDNSNGNSSVDNNKPDDSMQVKLLYYIIEFNANGGTKLSRRTMTLLNDDNIGIMPKVQCENYIFNGWYTQKSGGTKVTSSTVLNAGTTLFAQWIKVNKPSKVKAPSLKSQKAGQIVVSFKKITGADGYEIAYSANKKFPSSSGKKIVSDSVKKTLGKLKSGKKYYVRIRAYKTDSTGKKVYGAYSEVRSIKVK